MLEEEGVVDPPDLLFRVGIILHLDASTIERLQIQDRQAAGDWLHEISKPIRPYLGVNSRPMPCTAEVPKEVVGWGPVAIEEYASEFARSNRMEVHAVLSRRIKLEFNRDGELLKIREAG
jgi:hypothetical protein